MERQRDSKTPKKDISGAGLSAREPAPSAGGNAERLLPASGLYAWKKSNEELLPGSSISAKSMELRLDVDGHTPLMTASGTVRMSISTRFHWIARLTGDGQDRWKGTIWYGYPNSSAALFPYDAVEIQVVRGASSSQHGAKATFSKGRDLSHELAFEFRSPYFHPVNFEFDYLEGQKEKATTKIDTWAHPNRPENLLRETLTMKTVFERAGFGASVSPEGGEVPISCAGANAVWNDQELHDVMQKYWSLYAPKAQWAFWVFYASLYEDSDGFADSSTYGIMFDNIGEQQRQGTAIFNDSRVSNPPNGDTYAKAWVERRKFFFACHEMGHCFNLAHSWEKENPKGTPWIHLENEPEARSFMNYPFRVKDGDTAFFADFEYRFSDGELLFIRHAPASFVEMGNAAWFDHYAVQEAFVSPEPLFRLELRVNRDEAIFEFMEPITLELKLTNISPKPLLVEKHLLSMTDSMTVMIKRNGRAARQLIPFARYDRDFPKEPLHPGKSLYESLFVSAGNNGWDLAEPGDYCVQVALHHDSQHFFSNKLKIRVLPPRSFEEEHVAQDFFSDEVGRVISFDGSCFLEKANNVLRDVAERLKNQKVAMHASVALGSALNRDFKQLVIEDQKPGSRFSIKSRQAKPEEAKKFLMPALISSRAGAAESFGHIDYKWYVERFIASLVREGEKTEARRSQEVLYETLSKRVVHGRGILKEVLEEIKKPLPDIKSKR